MRRLSIFTVTLALISSMAVGQEFTPYELEDMVKSSFSGCMKTQLNLPANAGADRSILEHIADARLTRWLREQLDERSMSSRRTINLAHAAMIAKSHKIGQECRAEIAR